MGLWAACGVWASRGAFLANVKAKVPFTAAQGSQEIPSIPIPAWASAPWECAASGIFGSTWQLPRMIRRKSPGATQSPKLI